jgi:glc operon protein GlcG
VRLTLREANDIVAEVITYSEKQGIQMSVSVCDEGGRLKAFARMDEATLTSVFGSQAKAIASAAFRRHGREMQERADTPTYQHVVRLDGSMWPGLGAAPIYRDGILIGACAVGGGNAEQDEEAPALAIEKVIGPQPPPRG